MLTSCFAKDSVNSHKENGREKSDEEKKNMTNLFRVATRQESKIRGNEK